MTAPDQLAAIEARSDYAMTHESLAASDYAEMAWDSARDIPALLTMVREQRAALDRVEALHKPEKRWTHPDWTGSFDTREEAAEYDYDEAMGDDQKSQVEFFEVCAECGRVESEQLSEAGDGDWSYRESLWPCETIAAITGEGA